MAWLPPRDLWDALRQLVSRCQPRTIEFADADHEWLRLNIGKHTSVYTECTSIEQLMGMAVTVSRTLPKGYVIIESATGRVMLIRLADGHTAAWFGNALH